MNGLINIVIVIAVVGMGLGSIIGLAGGRGKYKERASTLLRRAKSVKRAKQAQDRVAINRSYRDRVRDKFR